MAERVYPRTYSVEQITYYIREYLGEDQLLSSLAVVGEVSSFKVHSSGHIYLTLQEGDCHLKAILFRRYAVLQQWLPREGERVVVIGRVSLYERDSSVQLYAQALFPADGDAGTGQQQAQEALKRRLEAEGLFSPERKRSLPPFALQVGVVTAESSAAWADMDRILHNRLPSVQVHLYPALVQGERAPASLAAAIDRADRGRHDVLIVGRGGGANEDLSAFNTELVVRAIAAAQTPVISAVGHESDVTLADLVADVRAATPTHAATLAVPDGKMLRQKVEQLLGRLSQAAQGRLSQEVDRLERLSGSPWLQDPCAQLALYANRLGQGEKQLGRAFHYRMEVLVQRLDGLTTRLALLDPLATLDRGYSLVLNTSGQVLRSAKDCRVGDSIQVRFSRGSVTAQVTAVKDLDAMVEEAGSPKSIR